MQKADLHEAKTNEVHAGLSFSAQFPLCVGQYRMKEVMEYTF